MNRIVENYGEDIDGNRGILMVSYELDEDDAPEIEKQLRDYLEESGEHPEPPFTVYLIDPITDEDVEMEIDPEDYNYHL